MQVLELQSSRATMQGDGVRARDVARAADEHAEGRGIQEQTSAMVATYQEPYLDCRSPIVRCHAITQMNHLAVQLMKPESCRVGAGSLHMILGAALLIRRDTPDDHENLPCSWAMSHLLPPS